MSTTLVSPLRLSVDQLRAAAPWVDVDEFPTVLAVRPDQATVDHREAVLDRAAAELMSVGLISGNALHPGLAAVLATLGRPDRELAMRLVTPDGTARVCVVRRGQRCVLARRLGQQIEMRVIAAGTELCSATTALQSQLRPSASANIEPVGTPLVPMSETLCSTDDPHELADRIAAVGAPARAAMLLASALVVRQAFAEIVYYALDHEQSRVSRGPAAVVVFYTKRGRIIAAPSASPTGELWSTLKPGSDHVFGQAIGQLVEVSHQPWETPDPGLDPGRTAPTMKKRKE